MVDRLSAVRSIVRVATAIAIVAAVAGQLQYLADHDLLRTVNFFSFFTIDSNLLACVTLLGLEMSEVSPLGRIARLIRGGATLYMTMTGIIYAVLLAPIAADVSTQLDWVNLIVHVVAPLVMVVDWVTSPPDPAPTTRQALWWLSFPIAWLAYTFVRGSIVDWYPYPFLDPREGVENASGSWPVVIVMTVVLAVVVAVLALGLRWIAAKRVGAPAGSAAA